MASWSPPVQTIWIRPEVTQFSEVCDACASEGGFADVLAARVSLVAGSLRPTVDVRWVSCPRGHRIRVRRVARSY